MELVHQLSEYKNLTVKGLMCIPPIDDTEEVRKYFAQMRKLFVDISSKKLDNIDMCILSMGMSGDFEVAIEEGATFVRVGTALFGVRKAKKWAPQSTGLTTDEFSRSLDTDDFV